MSSPSKHLNLNHQQVLLVVNGGYSARVFLDQDISGWTFL